MELGLELILQTPLFSVPQGLWTPNLAGWSLRMREPHPQNHVTPRYCGHVTSKKRYIFTFTRPMITKLSRVVTLDEENPPRKSRDTLTKWSCDKQKIVYLHFRKTCGPQT